MATSTARKSAAKKTTARKSTSSRRRSTSSAPAGVPDPAAVAAYAAQNPGNAADPVAVHPATATAPATTSPAPTTGVDLAAIAALIQTSVSQAVAAATGSAATPADATAANRGTQPNSRSTKVGELVSHAYVDPFDGPTTKYGIVVAQAQDQLTDPQGAVTGQLYRSQVVWLGHELSGPIRDDDLTPVS